MIELSRFPRVRLAHLPTPLEEMPRLGESLGVRLLVKRDDCTGLAFGGNKTRKLEFTLAHALAGGADTVLTSGGVQSNHVRQTAAAAARLGLECHVVVSNPLPDAGAAYRSSGNMLLDQVLGAEVHMVADGGAATDAKLEELVTTLRNRGRSPYVVPLGASHGIGALGYVECAREIVEECRERDLSPSHIFLATGSAGTHGGLLAGLRLLGSDMRAIGVSVSEPADVKRAKVRDLVGQVAGVLEHEIPLTDDDVVVFDEWSGPAYGVPTDAADEAIRRVARTEGLLLDPVYTGKAMAGMLALLTDGLPGEVRDPIFLHTGGAPALFAYPG